jgi:transglutaminase/protease-like cytokinesis protein 3
MVGVSGEMGSLAYQGQVSRENQIQRSQESSEERVEQQTGTQEVGGDSASFSAEALELSRAPVTQVSEAPESANDTQTNQSQQPDINQGAAMPGNLLNVVA